MKYISFVVAAKFKFVARIDDEPDFDIENLDLVKKEIASAFIDGVKSREGEWDAAGMDFTILSAETESANVVEL